MYLKSSRVAMATFLAPQHRGESMTDSFVIWMSSTLQSPNVENNEIFRHMGFSPPQLLDSPQETRRHDLQACESRLGRTRRRPRSTSSEPRSSVRPLAAEAGSTSGADTPPPPVPPPPAPPPPVPPPAEHLLEIVLPIIVTAPVAANAPPQRISAELSRLMLVCARISPSNNVPEPRVAELPT